jgi:hypothetical protein
MNELPWSKQKRLQLPGAFFQIFLADTQGLANVINYEDTGLNI